MDSGFYAAYTGLMAKTRELDVTANNLANVNTTGYKAEKQFYSAIMAATNGAKLSPLNRAMNDYGILGGTTLDTGQGSLDHTSNDLDVAIEGHGFFSAKTKAGTSYTRNGNFHVDPNGNLLTAQSDPVLGANGPIRITGQPVSISSDGTISVKGAVVDRLALVDFAPGTSLSAQGNSYIAAPAGTAKPAAGAEVRQGYLESSNYNSVTGMVGLVALQQHASMLRHALTLFSDTLDKSAAQDLPRVG